MGEGFDWTGRLKGGGRVEGGACEGFCVRFGGRLLDRGRGRVNGGFRLMMMMMMMMMDVKRERWGC